jgi:phenylacetic acid degradation protein
MVGMNAVVMDEAVVGESAIVAACAFVKAGMVIAPQSLAAGVPAKVLRPLTEEEIAWKGSGTRTYQELAVRSMATLREVAPLTAAEPERPRIKVSDDVVPKIALRKA